MQFWIQFRVWTRGGISPGYILGSIRCKFWVRRWIHSRNIPWSISESNREWILMQIIMEFWIQFCTNSDFNSELILTLIPIEFLFELRCISESNPGRILAPTPIQSLTRIGIHLWVPVRRNSESNSGQFLNAILSPIRSMDPRWYQFQIHSWSNSG